MSTLHEDRRCHCGAYGLYGYNSLGKWFCAKHSPDRANDAARLIQARCRELLALLIDQNLRVLESFATPRGEGDAARLMPQNAKGDLDERDHESRATPNIALPPLRR